MFSLFSLSVPDLLSVHVSVPSLTHHRTDTCADQGARETFSAAHPSHFFAGAPYPAFYPPDARNYQYKRHLMVAVDGSKESEHAVEWTIGHLCRSGDLLHIVHVETAGDMDPRLNTYGSFARTHPPSIPGARNDIGLAVPFPAYVSDDDDGDDDASWAPKPMLEFRVSPALEPRLKLTRLPPKKNILFSFAVRLPARSRMRWISR